MGSMLMTKMNQILKNGKINKRKHYLEFKKNLNLNLTSLIQKR